jgi:hypothetical protein
MPERQAVSQRSHPGGQGETYRFGGTFNRQIVLEERVFQRAMFRKDLFQEEQELDQVFSILEPVRERAVYGPPTGSRGLQEMGAYPFGKG